MQRALVSRCNSRLMPQALALLHVCVAVLQYLKKSGSSLASCLQAPFLPNNIYTYHCRCILELTFPNNIPGCRCTGLNLPTEQTPEHNLQMRKRSQHAPSSVKREKRRAQWQQKLPVTSKRKRRSAARTESSCSFSPKPGRALQELVASLDKSLMLESANP